MFFAEFSSALTAALSESKATAEAVATESTEQRDTPWYYNGYGSNQSCDMKVREQHCLSAFAFASASR